MDKKYLLIGNIILLIMAVIWVVKEDSMEPKIAIGTFTLTLLGLFFSKNKEDSNSLPANMTQKSGDNSKQYQSRGDMTINEK